MADHRDVIVESDGTGVGTILGVILAIVVVLAIAWFFFLGGMGTPNQPADQTTIEIQQPPVEPVPEQPM
jgi:FlaG/FlaF family flagellin (archaellin)